MVFRARVIACFIATLVSQCMRGVGKVYKVEGGRCMKGEGKVYEVGWEGV